MTDTTSLAAALKIIQNLLDGSENSKKEAQDFMEGIQNGEFPKPKRFQLTIANAPPDMPAYAAYVFPSISADHEPGAIPTGQVLLNLSAILWTCVAEPDIVWDELAADSISHEILHAIQDLLGKEMSEYDIEKSIAMAREHLGSDGMPDMPIVDWIQIVDSTMELASVGSVMAIIDPTHPESAVLLKKQYEETEFDPTVQSASWITVSDVDHIDIVAQCTGDNKLWTTQKRDISQ